jgi:diguanylate cyclase (GGDEF)-like protein
MPKTEINGAVKVAEAIKKEIGNLKIPHAQSEVNQYVSLSMGVKSTVPGLPDKPETFISNADKSLYQAKKDGRDRIVAAER